MFQKYYSLTKPGVLYGNVLTGAAGFLLAAAYLRQFDAWLFVATIAGMTLVIASACVLNNVLDRDIDSLMERTKKRATASGAVEGKNAVIFSIVLGVLGAAMLYFFVNLPVVIIGLAGFFVYVVLYGMLSKRLSIHGTLVGSVSGAAPILAGYVAVTGVIDAAAIILFLALFFWQMPEFYSIAIYRRKEYKAAGVPVMSVIKGVKNTKIQIFIYTLLFVVTTLLMTIFGYVGYIYLAVMAALGWYWIWLGVEGLRAKNSDRWARQMFKFSLVMLLVFSAMLPLGALLP